MIFCPGLLLQALTLGEASFSLIAITSTNIQVLRPRYCHMMRHTAEIQGCVVFT